MRECEVREVLSAPPLVVLDTNVFVAAGFRARSASAAVVGAVRQGRLRMAWSDGTRGETEIVVNRIPPLAWGEFAPLFVDGERVVSTVEEGRWDAVVDPADRKFAAVAAAAGAVLVTADAHLLSVRDGLGVVVMTAGEAVERLGLGE